VCSPTTQRCELVGDAVDAGNVVPADASTCYGGGLVRVCLLAAPSGTLQIAANQIIDTDTSPLCTAATITGGTGCVVAASVIEVAGKVTLSATGTRPLILLATGALAIDGVVDVASHAQNFGTDKPGAGADPAVCGAAAMPKPPCGGAGGSFGGRGGDGGATQGCGGAAGPTLPPTTLHGGCPGTTTAMGGGGLSRGGNGGGAVYVIAATISVDGTINASGMGGHGAATGSNPGGGGGGGAGGMIGLDAEVISVTGQVFANGGGGGASGGAFLSGADGADPQVALVAALGGHNMMANSADGGSGAAGDLLGGGAGGYGTLGGGGGGGGAGVIVVHGQLDGTMISPRPSP
jgi:hypothetical protein